MHLCTSFILLLILLLVLSLSCILYGALFRTTLLPSSYCLKTAMYYMLLLLLSRKNTESKLIILFLYSVRMVYI